MLVCMNGLHLVTIPVVDDMPVKTTVHRSPWIYSTHDYDISIDLKPDARLRHGPVYSVTVEEDTELWDTMNRMLKYGLIRPSKSPMASPVIFVRKKGGKLRMCIDFRRLNEMTIKNVYPLPKTGDLVEKLRGAKIFTKLYLLFPYYK